MTGKSSSQITLCCNVTLTVGLWIPCLLSVLIPNFLEHASPGFMEMMPQHGLCGGKAFVTSSFDSFHQMLDGLDKVLCKPACRLFWRQDELCSLLGQLGSRSVEGELLEHRNYHLNYPIHVHSIIYAAIECCVLQCTLQLFGFAVVWEVYSCKF